MYVVLSPFPEIYCQGEITTNFHGTFIWNTSVANEIKIVPCPLQLHGNETVTEEYAIRLCNMSTAEPGVWNWSQPDTSRCSFLSSTTRELQNLSMVRKTEYCKKF